MALPIVTPPSGKTFDTDTLEDLEPYKGTLVQIQFTLGDVQYGSEQRLTLDWELEELGPNDTIRDWIGLRLGKSKSTGGVSKLRQLLNALAGKPADTEIAFFDPNTLEWGYVMGEPFSKLYEGAEVVLRGEHGQKADGSDKFSVTKYQPVKGKKAGTSSAAERIIRAKNPQDDPDEIPF